MVQRAAAEPLVRTRLEARARICSASDGRSYTGSGAAGCVIDSMPYRVTDRETTPLTRSRQAKTVVGVPHYSILHIKNMALARRSARTARARSRPAPTVTTQIYGGRSRGPAFGNDA